MSFVRLVYAACHCSPTPIIGYASYQGEWAYSLLAVPSQFIVVVHGHAKEPDMRRLFVVFIIPACVLAGIVLLFTLLNTSPASAFPSLSHESGLPAVDPAAANLPVSEPEIDPAGAVGLTSR
jgi:hypothetical protein